MERALDWQQEAEAGDRSWTAPVLSGTRLRPESPICSWGAGGFLQWASTLGHCEFSGQREEGPREGKEVPEWLEGSQPGLFWVPSQSWVRARCHELRQQPLPSCRQELQPTPTPVHLACHCATPNCPLPSGSSCPTTSSWGILNTRCGNRTTGNWIQMSRTTLGIRTF